MQENPYQLIIIGGGPAGLMAAAQAAPLQSWLVGGAMGFRGDVPELCR